MRVAVVVPRYGRGILGGAESQARGFAEEAVRRGWHAEVWTTCARDHYTWANELPVGVEQDGGVTVRRFPVALRNVEAQRAREAQLAARGELPPDEQFAWLDGGAHSPALVAHVAARAGGFDAVVALPYATPLIHAAAWAAPDRVLLWPCLHDEPYAFLQPVHLLMESVWGVMFNSPEEQRLALRQLRVRPRHQMVLGEGVTLQPPPVPVPADPQTLLFLGRLEGGKNLSLLYDYVRRYADEGGDLRLVVGGRGPLMPPSHPAFDYRGFITDDVKGGLYASALALCQPSLFESFSLVIMESWLAGRPVLVHRDCPVTKGHVRRSHGGLWFSRYEEFRAVIEWLRQHPDRAARMGANGRRYVQRNYSWAAVVERFERAVRRWRAPSSVSTPLIR